jgi:broad specificity phosphatase PhoE
MLFYFVRHGETDFNRQHRLAGGGLDHCLNETGHSQAVALARELKKRVPHKVHRLIASSMVRTRETAGYLAQELGMKIELMHEFREWELGEWEGSNSSEFIAQILGEGEPREGESRKTFYSRIERAWRSVHSDSEPYILVSHGAVWLAMQDLLKIPRFKIDNCALVKVTGGGEWKAEVLK